MKTCRELSNRFQTEGFFNPICVLDKDGLGMKIPDKSFGIGEVRSAVGSRRLLDVMNVNSKFFPKAMKSSLTTLGFENFLS